MISSIEMLDRFRAAGVRERVEVLEHKPARELVTPVDIDRGDALGRTVCACPAGSTPPHWLKLTREERQALVEAPDPPPDGTLEPGHGGFTPRNVKVGFTFESGATW